MKCTHNARSEFLTAVLVKIQVLWDMTQCRLVTIPPHSDMFQATLTHSYYKDRPRAGRTLDQPWSPHVYSDYCSGITWPEREANHSPRLSGNLTFNKMIKKGNGIPYRDLDRPLGLQEAEAPRVSRQLALRTGRPYPQQTRQVLICVVG
jgi:hypothetical protein